MKISIKTLKGDLFQIEVESEDQVANLKSKIQSSKPDLPAERQKLIHAGKVLKDDQTVSSLGISESDFIVCMVTKETAKPKVATEPAAAPTLAVPAAAPTSSPATTVPSAPAPAPVAVTPAPPAAAPVSSPSPAPSPLVSQELVDNLMAMGFPEAETRAALSAAMGNPDLAYEFLLTGIPEHALRASQARSAPAPVPSAAGAADIQQLRQHPQFNALKQLIQQNPASLPQVLNLIGQQNPALLAAIHANNDAFLQMMNEPIGQPAPANVPAVPAAPSQTLPTAGGSPNPATMLQMLGSMSPEQRTQLAQSMGLSPEQFGMAMQMMASMPPEQLQQLMGSGGMGGMGGMDAPNVVRLTEEEMASVNRLVALGFDQQQAAQAFLACDRNEALAANFLLEGGFGDDDGGDDQGGFDGPGGDDMYDD